MRILVVANLPPHVMGGAEQQVAQLVEQWGCLGHGIEVAGHRIPDGVQRVGAAEVRTRRVRTLRWLGRAGRAASYALSLSWIALCGRRRYDIVYCRGLGDGALTLVALKALGLVRMPLVVCPINARGEGDVAFLRTVPGWRRWVGWANRHIQCINLINAEVARELSDIGLDSPLRTSIPNGIRVGAAPTPRQPRMPRVLCWTGRFSRQKGLDLLIKALASLRRDGIEFTLRLYGQGELEASLAELVRVSGIADQVEFLGAIPQSSVRERLRDCDVFVLPSRWEGMSNSALEAMEAGVPVACTACGGIDRHVEGVAGWVCAPDSEPALETMLRQVLVADDAALLDLGAAARRLIETRFRIEPVAARNLDVFERILAGRGTK